EFGNGTNTGSDVPIQVNPITGIVTIGAGEVHSLGLKNDGSVWAWGRNLFGELGNGTNNNSNVPVQVSTLTDITALAGGAGGVHSLALKNDGTLWAWGYNAYGELGNGNN